MRDPSRVASSSAEHATFASIFSDLAAAGGPHPEAVQRGFEAILAGAWSPVQVAGFAVALRVRGESARVIAAGVRAMRAAMIPVDHGLDTILDTCGTGGDSLGTINLSTAAAIVVAAAGVPVAKHGNRAFSSRAGSADLLEALGIPIDLAPERQAAVLRAAGITFLYAPAHHPALRHAGVARQELGVRTIFNVLGPLANPARATHQLLGAYDDALRPIMAETLRSLGVRRAWVVRGEDGLDELSPAAATRVSQVDGDSIVERIVTPEEFGLERVPLEALRGGDAAENARIVGAILDGSAHPARAAVVLNAAAALAVAKGLPLREAAALAEQAIASGGAREKLSLWRSVARHAKQA